MEVMKICSYSYASISLILFLFPLCTPFVIPLLILYSLHSSVTLHLFSSTRYTQIQFHIACSSFTSSSANISWTSFSCAACNTHKSFATSTNSNTHHMSSSNTPILFPSMCSIGLFPPYSHMSLSLSDISLSLPLLIRLQLMLLQHQFHPSLLAA